MHVVSVRQRLSTFVQIIQWPESMLPFYSERGYQSLIFLDWGRLDEGVYDAENPETPRRNKSVYLTTPYGALVRSVYSK